MQGDRRVGGLWCHEVLERLSDYVDGELSEPERQQIDDHLRECDTCERFGGRFAESIRVIRESLQSPGPLEDQVSERLHRALGTSD